MHAPNGFYRQFQGDAHDPAIEITCDYERSKVNIKKLTGNLLLKVKNNTGKNQTLEIADNNYKSPAQTQVITHSATIVLKLGKSFNWYDFTVRLKGNKSFLKRYAGRVETGVPGKTDPAMGKAV